MSNHDYRHSLSNHVPARYNQHADFVYSSKFTGPVLDLLGAKAGERIIDLGCGSGELTESIKDLVGDHGEVWAVDSSESMLEAARSRVSCKGITFLKGDIQCLEETIDSSLKGTFDAVFSSATFHWCKRDPRGVIDSVKWLLKPGGRLAFEMGGFGNCVGVRSAIHEVLKREGVDPIPLDPWYFPTVSRYTNLISQHGLRPGFIEIVPRPTPLPTDMLGWLQTFVRSSWFASFDDQVADKFMKEVADMCRPDAYWSIETPGMGDEPAEKDSATRRVSSPSEGWWIIYGPTFGEYTACKLMTSERLLESRFTTRRVQLGKMNAGQVYL